MEFREDQKINQANEQAEGFFMIYSEDFTSHLKEYRNFKNSKKKTPNSKIDGKQLRRSKRQVIYEDVVDDRNDDSDAEEAILRRQLEQLTDDELASLSHIARNDMNRYVKPRYVTVPQYEIIEIPDEILDNAVMEVYPRDRRSVVPVEWSEVHEPEEAQYSVGDAILPQARIRIDLQMSSVLAILTSLWDRETGKRDYFAVPQEAVIEALKQEQDEQELRDRIAELAQILNERAYRGGVRL
ncbi:hypothetical protein DICVIV_00242 [Dictyocaulus viviparus]|uniref:Uncharacterized protein n=1 Tax=Dictyocaulus viviparus TaxID=29172 RepID=A0A0D8YBS4_DICVI|nr:hypothetical protein DICVIV_00242 [Dictyocaulus viviparus]